MLPDGICYTIQNATTLYTYPDLPCTEGGTLPSFSNRTRDTYIRGDNGIYVLSSRTTTSNTIGTTLSVTHLWNSDWWNLIHPQHYVLPATLLIICFFSLILKMFMGVRR